MRKTTLIFLLIIFSITFSIQTFGQTHRDIAVTSHFLNHPNNLTLNAPNFTFSGWTTDSLATYSIVTSAIPATFVKDKIMGLQFNTCTVGLSVSATQGFFNPSPWGTSAELLINGPGKFNVVCGTVLVISGTFGASILHVSNNSNSATITLLNNSVTYNSTTTIINNTPGNFSWNNGSLSIAIITQQPVLINSTPGSESISGFNGFSTTVFGAVKI